MNLNDQAAIRQLHIDRTAELRDAAARARPSLRRRKARARRDSGHTLAA